MKNITSVVNNVPDYAKNYNYWVVNRVNGQLWFWGAWNDRDTANEVALEIGGITLKNE